MTDAERGPAAPRYDVAVLGNHLATSLLAAILAQRGLRVVLVPADGDRGLPCGETTVPYTAELFFLLGAKFGIPEISALGRYSSLPDELRASCSQKRNLGFLYHHPGRPHQPAEALQFTVPAEHAESHLYRPDADAHGSALATARGATVLATPARPGGTRIGRDGVAIELADGRSVQAEYLVNGSGDPAHRPAGVTGPRPGRLRHQSQLLFTHLTGVRPFESVVPRRGYGKVSPWSQGTLLHTFDGGWIQVTPFGGDGSSDQRCGVAVSIDTDAGLRPGSAAARFTELIERFPDLRRQFAGAAPTEPWQVFESWPAVADECAGPRWFLFDRAAGRQDLLLSRDLTMSLELVHAVATSLLTVARSGDWAGGGMKEAGEFQLRLFSFHDRFIAAGRVATRDFRLWNAYLRVWLLWSILSALSLKRARLDGGASLGDSRWSPVERFDQGVYWYQVPDGLPGLIARTLEDIESVQRGAPASAVAHRIFARLRAERFVPPLYRFGHPGARYYRFTRSRRLRMLLWSKTTAPPDFRRLLTMDNVTAAPAAARGARGDQS